MRTPLFALMLLAVPLAGRAQAPTGSPPAAISRDQFIARASQRAARVFDAIDVNHTGSITRDQLRAFRQAHAVRTQ